MKRLLLALLLAALAVDGSAQDYARDAYVFLPEDLWGKYALDEATGTRVNSSGDGPDLAETGSIGSETGVFSNAASNTETTLAQLAGTAVAPMSLDHGFTVAFWLRLNAWTSSGVDTIVHLADSVILGRPYLHITRFFDSDFVTAEYAHPVSGSTGIPLPRIGPLTVDQWHHIAVRYNPGTEVFDMIVDGTTTRWALGDPLPAFNLAATIDSSLVTGQAWDYVHIIGRVNVNHESVGGGVDDFMIWSRPLGDEEIVALARKVIRP